MVGNISVVTFVSGYENVNESIFHLCEYLNESGYGTDILTFLDHVSTCDQTFKSTYVLSPGETKFNRIKKALEMSSSEFLLFIDNDISPNNDNILSFLRKCPSNVDLAWGIIGVQKEDSLMSKLITIDKNISHYIIRPILWNFQVGISVPGQILLMKRKTFIDALDVQDTIFDDLTIGLLSRKTGYTTWYTADCLGEEKASNSFGELIKQRKRWGKGFRETWELSKKMSMVPYCAIHAFIYHFMWILLLIMYLFLLVKVSVRLFLMIVILSDAIICKGNMTLMPVGILYMVIFPVVHSIWFSSFLKSKVKLS